MIRDEDLVAESRRKGALLRERLDALAAGSPRIGDVRGLGLLQGLELVEDRETLAPPPGAASRLVAACRERGLMIYACPTPMGATTIEAVMLAPPLTIADAELDEVVAILGDALRRDGLSVTQVQLALRALEAEVLAHAARVPARGDQLVDRLRALERLAHLELADRDRVPAGERQQAVAVGREQPPDLLLALTSRSRRRTRSAR